MINRDPGWPDFRLKLIDLCKSIWERLMDNLLVAAVNHAHCHALYQQAPPPLTLLLPPVLGGGHQVTNRSPLSLAGSWLCIISPLTALPHSISFLHRTWSSLSLPKTQQRCHRSAIPNTTVLRPHETQRPPSLPLSPWRQSQCHL